jgi:hypothetical protein
MRRRSSWSDLVFGGSGRTPLSMEGTGRRVLLAALKAGWLYSLAVWVYSAAIALAFPQRVDEPLLLMNGLPRTDTTGIVAIGVSILCFVTLESVRSPGGCERAVRRFRRIVDSSLRAIAIYGFLGWLYIAANAIQDPFTLPLPLTHLSNRPTESQFGLACFVLSVLGSFAWWATKRPDEHDAVVGAAESSTEGSA